MRRFAYGRPGSLNGARKGIFAIAGSSALGQIVALLGVPIISRLYTPTDVGIFATTMAVVTVATVVAPLRFDSALQVAPDKDVVPMLGFTVFAAIVASAVCAASIAISLTGEPWGVAYSSLLVAFLVFTGALTNVLSSLVLRSRQYADIARRSLARQVGTTGFQVGNSTWIPGFWGLLLGAQAGQLLGLGFLLRQAKDYISGQWHLMWRWGALRPYWRFPAILAPSALLNALGIQIPLLVISGGFGSADAGNLAQALRVGAAPVLVIGTAFSSVMMAEISRNVRQGQLDQRSRFLRVSKGLLGLGFAWLFVLLLVVPPLLPAILGRGWDDTGSYTRAVAVQAAASLVVAPLSVVLIIYERALTVLLIDVGRICLMLGIGFLGIAYSLGPIVTCALICSAGAAVYGATWMLCLETVSASSTSSARRGRRSG